MERVFDSNCLADESFTQADVQRIALWRQCRNWFVKMTQLMVSRDVVNYK